ncbi:MAG TPA: hypothetical protein PKZ08_00590 [Vicinamibacterales bacterium]|nr:hypothetical protein [Vicinamibacterales bacterium]
MSFATTGYRAALSALKADTAVAAYMAANGGHWYLYDLGAKHPVEITGSDCPMIACIPGFGDGALPAATNVSHDVTLNLLFDVRVQDENSDAVVDLWALVVKALMTRFKSDRFGAAATGLYLCRPGAGPVSDTYGKSVAADGEERLVRVAWKMEFTVALVFRRNLAA